MFSSIFSSFSSFSRRVSLSLLSSIDKFEEELVLTKLFPSKIPFASITNSSDSTEPVIFPFSFISTLVAQIEPSINP